jgi:NADPH:quinone reductase-like Zn-dependent oxidoreductase
MKAVICPKYGPPEVLTIRELPRPTPKKNEVLVKIFASTVNTGDVRIRGLRVKGFMKFVLRIVLGVTKPRRPILGTVFSGIVEQVGETVNQFKVGQEVYGTTGFKQGCHCEYLCISENKVITHKPENASFEEAASLPFGGQAAIYFLRKGKIAETDNLQVLIYGATGSVGTAAVQIAKHYSAKVTAVCGSKGKELTHFEIAGEDNLWYPAKAVIKNNQVIVSSRKVKEPVNVRFAWSNSATPNLFNSWDLPASSFTSK